MGRKKKPILEDILIEDIGGEGKALSRVGGKIVFVPFAIPGDVVDIQVQKSKESYTEGFVLQYKKYSDLRIKAKCGHFGVCGGCSWQHLPYEKQLIYKQKQVIDFFVRLGKLKGFEARYILPSENIYHYRNKLEFSFSTQRWLSNEEVKSGEEDLDRRGLGFYLPKKFFRILDIKNCYLQPEPSNSIRLELRKYIIKNNIELYDQRTNVGFIRSIIIRNTSIGEWLIIVTFHHESPWLAKILDHLRDKFPQITSIYYVINPKLNDIITDLKATFYWGKPHITEEMENLKFRISPKSFYQTNSQQAYTLYKVTRDFAGLKGHEVVYDLYTGTGTIANFVAKNCKKVVGIEYVEEAIIDARINSADNNIANTVFYAGDMKDVLREPLIEKEGKPDVIITDPPRAGMHPDVVKTILKAKPKKVVYVSCNPSTQVRDIQMMNDDYKLKCIQPVDMFPQTFHVENVALLERR